MIAVCTTVFAAQRLEGLRPSSLLPACSASTDLNFEKQRTRLAEASDLLRKASNEVATRRSEASRRRVRVSTRDARVK